MLEAGLSTFGTPRRRVKLAVEEGAAGADRVRRISERLSAGSREAFDLEPLRIPKGRGPEDPAPLMDALLAGEAEFGACGAEQLPLELPAGIRLEGAMRAGDPQYRMLSAAGRTNLDHLDAGSALGAIDAAARAQLLFLLPTIEVELVPLESLLAMGMSHGVWDGAIVSDGLAAVPGLELHSLPPGRLVAPSGRGVIALLAADASDPAEPWRRLLNEPETEDCLLCERTFLARMTGWAEGLPIARASRIGARLELNGLLAHPDGKWLVGARASGPPSFGRILGLEVAESCRDLAASHLGSTRRMRLEGNHA